MSMDRCILSALIGADIEVIDPIYLYRVEQYRDAQHKPSFISRWFIKV